MLFAALGCGDTQDGLLRPTLATLKHPAEKKFIAHEGIKELCEKHLGMTYLYKSNTDIPELENLTENSLANSGNYLEREKLYGDLVKDSYLADIYVKFINDEIGYGTFANSDIKKHQLIGEYTGLIHADRGDSTWAWDYPADGFKSELHIPAASLDAKYKGNGLRFLNHHDNANVSTVNLFSEGLIRILCVANQDIKKDEQIFVNYGDKYWSARKKQLLN